MKRTLSIALVVMIAISLSSCNQGNESVENENLKILGGWTYEVNGDKVTITGELKNISGLDLSYASAIIYFKYIDNTFSK